MRALPLFVGLVLIMARAIPVQAAERALDLLDPAVSYFADFQVSGDKGRYQGKVWHVPGREKREFSTKGGGQAVLLRRDTDSAYLLKPGGRWFVGLSLSTVGALAGGLDGLMVERSRQGSDTIAGLATTRYKVSGAGPMGSRFDGSAWFTRDGIMMAAKGVLTDGRGRKSEVETALSNVTLGHVDAQIFEPPTGWFAMDLRSVPAERLSQVLETMRPMLEGGGAHQ